MDEEIESGEVVAYTVLNESDHTYATPANFCSRAEAEEFIAWYRETLQEDGFYETKNGDRIPPEEVRLRIVALRNCDPVTHSSPVGKSGDPSPEVREK